jgi:hypothetical protein
MMHSNPSLAQALINDCLQKCGFIRCFKSIISSIDAQIVDDYTKVELKKLNLQRSMNLPKETDKSVVVNLLSNDPVNRELKRKLRDTELIWIERFAIDGKFTINARRTPKNEYYLDFVLSIPKSPTNKGIKTIKFPIRLYVRGVTPPDFDLDYDDTEVDEESVQKALMLYSVNKLD